ncbi:hypothetical protein CWE08_09920 [Aliidiomarina iranensis]|uniref:2-amino-4-hydroxy-6-hydroxymethyldihydropteridine pyrophosphokinase n=1 Tax=Aliidiomarina iranensis TaxID=1434071 RepID=A0A432VSH8_9GAMM|nr:hypothetical protein CWE08_09920 [Aliidiomarina iranensis]
MQTSQTHVFANRISATQNRNIPVIFYLSLGSNLAPDEHIARALRELSERYGSILVLPIVRTEPCAINSSNGFLNTIAVISSKESSSALKAWLNSLEMAHGRDRNDPNRSTKDRTLDIDILLEQGCFDFSVAHSQHEAFAEPYVQASIKALDKYLEQPVTNDANGSEAQVSEANESGAKIDAEATSTPANDSVNTTTVRIPGAPVSLGHRAATIDFEYSSGDILIAENSLNTLLQRFEATFDRQQGFA